MYNKRGCRVMTAPVIAFSLGKVARRRRDGWGSKRLLSRKACVGMFISACAETNQRHVSACTAARFRLTPKDIAHLTALPSSRKTHCVGVLRERGGARERTEIFSAEKTESSALCADDDAWVLWHGDNARFGPHDFALMQRSLLPVFGSEQAQQSVHRAPVGRQ